ncbi:MAG: hypothetical protein AAF940_01630 [Pseudomonadota bacterium]
MRWSRILLVVSLLLNGLLIGFIAGEFSRPIQLAQALQEAGADYPTEIDRSIRRNIFGQRRALASEIATFNEDRLALFALMREPELDADAINAQFLAVRQQTSTVQAILQQAILDAVSEADLVTRQQIKDPEIVDPRPLSVQ